MRSRFNKLLALLVTALGSAHAVHAQDAEVIHWWTSGGEAAAIKEIANAYNKSGGKWIDSPVAGGGGAQARTVIINRTVSGDAPAAAQFNYGKWYEEAIKQGLLNNIDDVAAKGNWDKVIPERIKTAIKIDGHYYAAPVNLHNENWIWFNKAVLAKAGVSKDPTTLDEMFSAMDKIKAIGITPLAWGGQGWQEGIAFRSVLLGVGGKELYLKTLSDRDTSGPQLRKALEAYKRLKDYVDPRSPGRDWNVATAMVTDGTAGFQFMGDWAKGEFIFAKKTAGKDFGCFMAGGPKMPYAIDGDVFVFPKSNKPGTTEAQKKLAELVMSPAVQIAFNNKKGSIPVRSDIDLGSIDMCAQGGVQAIKENRLFESHIKLLSIEGSGAVDDVMGKFWNSNQSVDDAIKALAVAVKL